MKIEQVAVEGAVLTVYLRQPAEAMPLAATRPLVLVVPGGGYEHVSAREADPVAVRFLAAGYHAAVLEYGVGEQARDYRPFRQIDGALALLRERAAEWGIRPDKIAACGFSAGGHLALASAVLPLPGQTSWAGRQRPNALILSYPVVTAGPYAHRGSFEALSGAHDPAAHLAFGLEDKIGPDTPPVFLWHTMDDKTVPVENSLLLLGALQKAGVPCEAHLFPHGVHGLSVCTAEVNTPQPHAGRWFALAAEWLAEVFDWKLGIA